jgi:hypothetical protein
MLPSDHVLQREFQNYIDPHYLEKLLYKSLALTSIPLFVTLVASVWAGLLAFCLGATANRSFLLVALC